ncbi:MAG: hypothetical protein QF464_03095 [Myxococcota bacterium]|nr:hypothetical protein [Myxococcota bacterium]
MTRWTIFTGVALLTLLFSTSVVAKPTFVVYVPNGSTNGCVTCHVDSATPVTWNEFGDDLKASMVDDLPDWAAVCDLDSDGDGASNGLELGDPDCDWVFGDSDPPGDVFNPGDETSTPAIETPEDAGGNTDTTDAGSTEDEGTGDGPEDDTTTGGGTDGGTGGGTDGGTGGGTDGGTGGGTGGDGGGGCAGGSSAPLAGLALFASLALITRRRVI